MSSRCSSPGSYPLQHAYSMRCLCLSLFHEHKQQLILDSIALPFNQLELLVPKQLSNEETE